MCNPLILAAAATATQVVGAVAAGQAQSNAAKYNAAVADQNAQAQLVAAKDAQDRGFHDLTKLRERQADFMGTMKGAFAANNIDASYGSPLDVLTSTSIKMRLDQEAQLQNSNREVKDYLQQSGNYSAQAGLDRMNAKSAMSGAVLNAGGAILNGGAKIYSYGSQSGYW